MTAEAYVEPSRRLPPRPTPGADVGERHQPVEVTVMVVHREPNPKMRRRGDRLYPREVRLRYRTYRYAMNSDDALVPDGGTALVMRVAQLLARDLAIEEWPEQVRLGPGNVKSRA